VGHPVVDVVGEGGQFNIIKGFDGATVKQVVDEPAISLCAGHCIAP
jgi:hypothetical protein